MNLIKHQDLDVVPLKQDRRKLEKKYGKLARKVKSMKLAKTQYRRI